MSRGGGERVYYYDAEGNVVIFGDPDSGITNFSNDADGRQYYVHFPSGGAFQTWFDGASQITSMLNSYGAQLYTYDAVGNGSLKNGTSVYDNQDRLIRATGDGVFAYQYDNNSNIVSQSVQGMNIVFNEYNIANQHMVSTLVQYGEVYLTTFSYDLNGNQIEAARYDFSANTLSLTTMQYDCENRLSVYNDGSLTTYTYDGDGLKRGQNVAGPLTTLIWDGDEYVAETNP